MDLETVDAAAFGQSLSGLGLNLLCRDVQGMAGFLAGVFGLTIHRLSDDFALARHVILLVNDIPGEAHNVPGFSARCFDAP